MLAVYIHSNEKTVKTYSDMHTSKHARALSTSASLHWKSGESRVKFAMGCSTQYQRVWYRDGIQVVSCTRYIGIRVKSQKELKTTITKLGRDNYTDHL